MCATQIDIIRTEEFEDWYNTLPLKTQLMIKARLQKIEFDGHWGTVNRFDSLIELKWGHGLRIYTHLVKSSLVIT